MTEIERQGEFGEQVVADLFRSTGCQVFKNPDKYGTWDLIIEKGGVAQTAQIKTTVRFLKKNSFRFHIGKTGRAYETIRHCDLLIAVVRNPENYLTDREYGGKIVMIKNHRDFKMSSDGSLWIPSNKDTTKIIGDLTEEQLRTVDSFKTGKFK